MKKLKLKEIFLTPFKKKISSCSGETIAETLVTMIILSLAVLMLAGAVVTAARVNKKADNADTAFIAATSSSERNVVITYQDKEYGNQDRLEIPTQYYETQNNYKYYEAK